MRSKIELLQGMASDLSLVLLILRIKSLEFWIQDKLWENVVADIEMEGSEPSSSISRTIVWSISTCASLARRVRDFEVHKRLSWQNGPIGKSNWSNRFQLWSRFHHYFPLLNVQIRERDVRDGVWSDNGHQISPSWGNRCSWH
jgi:hypothetical protein